MLSFLDNHDLRFRIAAILFGSRKRIEFYTALALVMASGPGLQVVLTRMRDDAIRYETDKKDLLCLESTIYSRIISRIGNGAPFASAMKDLCPIAEQLVLQAGEEGNDLIPALEQCVTIAEKMKKIFGAIAGALALPVLYIVFITMYLINTTTTLLPAIESIIPRDTWEGDLYTLGVMGDLVTSFWGLVVLLGFGLLVFIIAYSFRRMVGKPRLYLEAIPPWSIYKRVVGVSWLLGFASMMKAGITPAESIRRVLLYNKSNRWLEERLTAIVTLINSGEKLGAALQYSGFEFPDRKINSFISLISETPNPEKELPVFAMKMMDEAVRYVKMQSVFLNMLGLGFVAFIISIIATASMSITNYIQ